MDDVINDIWTFYFHDPYDTDWTYSSYIRICNISDLMTFSAISRYLDNNISKGMFFIFRDGIFPCWDDTCNIKGGTLSFKISSIESPRFWVYLVEKILSDKLVTDGNGHIDSNEINGISISPKKDYCIIKIWIGINNPECIKYMEIEEKHKSNVMYQNNIEKISNHNLS